MIMARLRAPRGKVFYGWWVLLATSAIAALGGGSYHYGFSVFFLPLSTDLGLTRAETSLVFAASRLEGGIYGAAVGWFIDRYGARALLLLGGLLAGVGYVLLSQVDSLFWFMVVYLVVVSTGVNAGIFQPSTAVVNTWFIRRKSTTLGILSAAYSIGGALVAPALGLGIHFYGWRTTALIMGIILGSIAPLLALAVRRSPESMGLQPDGDQKSVIASASQAAGDFTVRHAMRTPSLWLMTTAITLRFLVQGAIVVHLVPLLVDKGVEETTAAGMMGLLALLSVPVGLTVGWLGDRVPKRLLLLGGVGIELVGLGILLTAGQVWQLYLFIFVYSLGYGGGMLLWAMLGEYYGRRNFATLRGLVGLVYTWGSLIGPIFAGWMFDRTGSYQMAITIIIIVYSPTLLLYWFCRKPKPVTPVASPSLA